MPRLFLRFEGAALPALATWAFASTGTSWWLYAVLFLTHGLSFAGYLAGHRLGAMAYNALHCALGPALMAGLGLFLDRSMLLGSAAVWAAHTGFDRMLGYGLKDSSGFNDTHPGLVGRQAAGA